MATVKISELPDAQSIGWDDPTAATGDIRAPDGAVNAPTYTFGNDLDTGFFSISANWIGTALGGGYGTAFTSVGQIIPANHGFTFSTVANPAAGTYDIFMGRTAAKVLTITDSSTAGAVLEMMEMTAPAAGAATTCRIFVRDNGGKTQLCAIFETGAIQVIATEP